MKLSSALEIFIVEKNLEGLREASINNYRSILGYFIEYVGDLDLKDVNRQLIKDYIAYISEKPAQRHFAHEPSGQLSRTTLRTYMTHVRSFFNYLYMEEYMDDKVFERIKIPKDRRKEIEILMPEEIEKLWTYFRKNESGVRYKAFMCLLLDTGIRRSEALALRVSDVRFQRGELLLPRTKNGHERVVPLGHLTKKELLRYINQWRYACTDGSDALFTMEGGLAMTTDAVKSLFIRLSKHLGRRVYPHLLRHTFATYYLLEFRDILALKQLLGHSDIAMVNKYLQLVNRIEVKDRSIMDKISKTRQIKRIPVTTF